MKIKLSEEIKGIDGKPLMNNSGVPVVLENGMEGTLNHGTKVITKDGETVTLQAEGEKKTLADIFMTACTIVFEEEQKSPDGNKIMELRTLGERFYDNRKGNIELTMEEVVMMKERVLKTYPNPLIYGGVCRILESYEKK